MQSLIGFLPPLNTSMQMHTSTTAYTLAQVCSQVKRNLTYLTDRNYSYAPLLTPRCTAWETMARIYRLILAQIPEMDEW